MNSTSLMDCGNMFSAGHADGGNAGGGATRALLRNVELVKQLAMLVMGTLLKAQLDWPPPVFHTGYRPVITMLLVKTNPYICAFAYTFPMIIMWLWESGNAVTCLMVTVLSGFWGQLFMISNAEPPPTYFLLRASRTTSWMLQRVPASAAPPFLPLPEMSVANCIPAPACATWT